MNTKAFNNVVIFVTASTRAEADRIAEVLLKERVAACVNIIPGVSSLFWWNGTIDSANENLLIIKTKASRIKEVVRLVKANHSYQVPEIISTPIISGNMDYLRWIDREVN